MHDVPVWRKPTFRVFDAWITWGCIYASHNTKRNRSQTKFLCDVVLLLQRGTEVAQAHNQVLRRVLHQQGVKATFEAITYLYKWCFGSFNRCLHYNPIQPIAKAFCSPFFVQCLMRSRNNSPKPERVNAWAFDGGVPLLLPLDEPFFIRWSLFYLTLAFSLCLCVSVSVCLPVSLSACLSVCLSLCLSVSLSVRLSACLAVCLAVCLCLSLCLSLCLPFPLFLSVSLSLSLSLSVCLSLSLSVSVSVFPSSSVCLAVCLSFCTSVRPSVRPSVYLCVTVLQHEHISIQATRLQGHWASSPQS